MPEFFFSPKYDRKKNVKDFEVMIQQYNKYI